MIVSFIENLTISRCLNESYVDSSTPDTMAARWALGITPFQLVSGSENDFFWGSNIH